MTTYADISKTLERQRFDLTQTELMDLIDHLIAFDSSVRGANLTMHYECLETCFDALEDLYAFDELSKSVALTVLDQARHDVRIATETGVRVAMATCVRMVGRRVPIAQHDSDERSLATLVAVH